MRFSKYYTHFNNLEHVLKNIKAFKWVSTVINTLLKNVSLIGNNASSEYAFEPVHA